MSRFRYSGKLRRPALGILVTSLLLAVLTSSASAFAPTLECTLQSNGAFGSADSNVGQNVTFRFHARNATPPGPAGPVVFFDDGVPFATELLTPDDLGTTDHSTVTTSTSSLSPGDHLITAVLASTPPSGNPCPGSPASPSLIQHVHGAQTTTSVASSVNPSVYGQNVTLTATVTRPGGTPSGTVQFQADGQDLGGPQTVDGSGHASVSTSTLAVGNHPITAAFTSSDPNALNSSGSLNGGQTVNAASTTTGVSSSVNPSVYGQNVTFTAAVTTNAPSNAVPSGTVQFQIDGQNFGGAQSLDGSGHASVSTSGLSAANHSITASFTSSSGNVLNSQGSLAGGQQVNPAATTTSVVSSLNPSEFAQTVSFTASVRANAPGSGTPSGTVQFRDNGTDIGGPRALDGSGNVSFDTSALTVGNHNVSALYTPNTANFSGSSGSVAQTVERARTTLVYTGPTEGDYHDPVTLSATLTRVHDSARLGGRSIGFTLGTQSCSGLTGGSGDASCGLTPSQIPGDYTVQASFAGDSVSLPSSVGSPFTITKQESKTTLSATPSGSSEFGREVTFTATVAEDGTGGGTPTGSVEFRVDGAVIGSAALVGGRASISTSSLRPGSHTVVASYGGDAYYLGSFDGLVEDVTCQTNLVGTHHSGKLTVPSSACIVGSEIQGDVVVEPGASLNLQGSTVAGDVDASRSPRAIRICGSTVSGRVIVGNATGLVTIGNQSDPTCGRNEIGTPSNPNAPAPPTENSTATTTAGSASFAGAAQTVTVSANGTFSYRFTASPLVFGIARFASDSAVAARARPRRRQLTLGQSSFQAPSSGSVTVTVKLSRANLRTLNKLKRLQVRLTVTIDGRDFINRFVLKAPKPKRRKR